MKISEFDLVSALMASREMADGGIKTLPDALTQMEQLFSSTRFVGAEPARLA